MCPLLAGGARPDAREGQAMSRPNDVKIGDARYTAVVLKVRSHDSFGRPRDLETLYPEESMKVKGGEEFVIVYMPKSIAEPDQKARA